MDVLRPPNRFDPTGSRYKEWLHLNLLDHRSGTVGVFNASLHGAPEDERSRAIGTALVHLNDSGWIGNVEVADQADATLVAAGIGLERVAVVANHADRQILVSARLPDDRLRADLAGRYRGAPVRIEHEIPFGRGWISWLVIPRLAVSGSVSAAKHHLTLDGAAGYHDHNWGRWCWGDDVGWEWGVFSGAPDGYTFIFSRACNRSHTVATAPLLVVDGVGGRRQYFGDAIVPHMRGRFAGSLRRLPGALAALHQSRRAPHLPSELILAVSDGVDRFELRFLPRAAGQLIAAEPTGHGYSFIHEMIGEVEAAGTISGRKLAQSGLGIFEYVD